MRMLIFFQCVCLYFCLKTKPCAYIQKKIFNRKSRKGRRPSSRLPPFEDLPPPLVSRYVGRWGHRQWQEDDEAIGLHRLPVLNKTALLASKVWQMHQWHLRPSFLPRKAALLHELYCFFLLNILRKKEKYGITLSWKENGAAVALKTSRQKNCLA